MGAALSDPHQGVRPQACSAGHRSGPSPSGVRAMLSCRWGEMLALNLWGLSESFRDTRRPCAWWLHPSSHLLGRCWVALVSRSVGIGVAGSLSWAIPSDAASWDAAGLAPKRAQQKPRDTRVGERWKLLEFRCLCSAPLTASVCKWCFPGATAPRARCDRCVVTEILFWELKIPCLGAGPCLLWSHRSCGWPPEIMMVAFRRGRLIKYSMFKKKILSICTHMYLLLKLHVRHTFGLTEVQFRREKIQCVMVMIIWKSLRIL